jgi:hypothetical protein
MCVGRFLEGFFLEARFFEGRIFYADMRPDRGLCDAMVQHKAMVE